jgi:hypothetical protein
MIRKDVSLLLDIENAYESLKLNVDSISYLQLLLGCCATDQNVLIHLTYLCEQDAASSLVEMKAAIDQLKPLLREEPTKSPSTHLITSL